MSQRYLGTARRQTLMHERLSGRYGCPKSPRAVPAVNGSGEMHWEVQTLYLVQVNAQPTFTFTKDRLWPFLSSKAAIPNVVNHTHACSPARAQCTLHSSVGRSGPTSWNNSHVLALICIPTDTTSQDGARAKTGGHV